MLRLESTGLESTAAPEFSRNFADTSFKKLADAAFCSVYLSLAEFCLLADLFFFLYELPAVFSPSFTCGILKESSWLDE